MRRFGQWFSVGAAVVLAVHALSSNAFASPPPAGGGARD